VEDFEIGRIRHLSKLFLAFLLLSTALTAQTGFPTFVDIAEKVGVTLMRLPTSFAIRESQEMRPMSC